MNDFYIRVKRQLDQQLPFVIYRKPDEAIVAGLFQRNDHVYFAGNFTETGFVMAPFHGEQIILIPKNESDVLTTASIPSGSESSSMPESDYKPEAREKFEALVGKGLDAIKKGVFGKVVLSRKELLEIPGFNPIEVFTRMTTAYPTAFAYCWFHPKIGLWMGATPEKLLKAENDKFYSMALAGTQKYEGSEDVTWQEKEKEEQQFVTDFILDNLRKVTTEVTVSSPYTAKAGNLFHIKTDIEGIFNAGSGLRDVVGVLHPTPAVCGYPKMISRDFILENEGYDREYYTGFLGELNRNLISDATETDLYVNLRCMKIRKDKVHVFVGCGITKDSNPEKEFIETVNKSMTMKKIIL